MAEDNIEEITTFIVHDGENCEIPLKIIDENNEEILCVEDTGDQTIVVLSDLILKGKTTEGKTIQVRKPEKCTFCGRVFRSGKLKRHIRTVHNDKTSFKCDFGNCKYGSKDKYSLKHHFETAHKGTKPSTCHICKTDFACDRNLKLHIANSKCKIQSKKKKVTQTSKTFDCPLCDTQLTTLQILKNHVASVHEGKKPYQCTICDKNFTANGSLKEHIANIHDGKKPFECPSCDMKFSTRFNLKVHSEKAFCDYCKMCFKTKENLVRHVTIHHEDKSEKKLSKIGKGTQMVDQIDGEELDHSLFPESIDEREKKKGNTYNRKSRVKKKETTKNANEIHESMKKMPSCVRCGNRFSDFEQLSSHMKISLNCRLKENDYFLSELGISSPTEKVIFKETTAQTKPKDETLVIRNVEPKVKEMVFCLTCGSGYNQKHDLLNHLKENSTCRMNENVKFLENIETKRGGHLLHSLVPKLVNVIEVEKDKGSKEGLSENCLQSSARIHTEEIDEPKSFEMKINDENITKPPEDIRIFQCVLCNEKFLQNSLLRAHISNLHEKHCNICNMDFIRNQTLLRHIETVHKKSKSEEYKCSVCSKTFSRKWNLTKHTSKVHSKEEKCPICDKNFPSMAQFSDLKIHIATAHEGRISYECSLCSRKFLNKYNLIRHMSTVHENEDNSQLTQYEIVEGNSITIEPYPTEVSKE